jgi:hypothetical protein
VIRRYNCCLKNWNILAFNIKTLGFPKQFWGRSSLRFPRSSCLLLEPMRKMAVLHSSVLWAVVYYDIIQVKKNYHVSAVKVLGSRIASSRRFCLVNVVHNKCLQCSAVSNCPS